MLRDLLHALAGYPGPVFVRDNQGCFKVNPSISNIHASEREQLQQVLSISDDIAVIRAFVNKYSIYQPPLPVINSKQKRASGIPSTTLPQQSIYCAALCEALSDIHNEYLVLLTEHEQMLNNPGKHIVTMTHIVASLSKYAMLFPQLRRLVEDLDVENNHDATRGCQILQLLSNNLHSGLPVVRTAFLRLQRRCHAVLYRQLVAWLGYGKLDDCFDEFFIKALETKKNEVNTSLNNFGKLTQVLPDRLPSYISRQSGDDIKFIGDCVALFARANQHTEVESEKLEKVEHVIAEHKKAVIEKLKEALVDDVEFSDLKFENTITQVRTGVIGDLWLVLSSQADLLKQLEIVKNMFLLGRGELFLGFIEGAADLLAKPASKVTAYELQSALRQAATQTYGDEIITSDNTSVISAGDPVLAEQVQIRTIPESEASTTPTWRCLELHSESRWPMGLVFTPSLMLDLNRLFRHLLHIRRVQIRLHDAWHIQNRVDLMKRSSGSDMALLKQSKFWQLRMLMIFVLDNIQYYLQADVLETSCVRLKTQLSDATCRDFEKVRQVLHEWTATLLTHAFINSPAILKSIYALLDTCEKYADLFVALWEKKTRLKDDQRVAVVKQLHELYIDFQRQSSMLFKLLSNSKNHQNNPYLIQLLLRIDFNRYFSNTIIF